MATDREAVLTYLGQKADHPLKPKELARALGVDTAEYTAFKQLLREMEATGEIYRVRKGRYALPEKINLVVGRLQTTRSGHGFVISEKEPRDLFVPAPRLEDAYEGDRVIARVERRPRGENPEGSIVKVLERARSQVVGAYHRSGRYGFVEPEDRKLHRDLFIPPGNEGEARNGDMVVARVVDWGSRQLNPVGAIVEVLGAPGEPGVDVLAIVHVHELPPEFPADVLREAEDLAERREITTDDLEGRQDFRELPTFTIDPEDARDHDDAVSLEWLEGERWRVGVHIADVSHFVQEGSPLDLEALQRGTSVYLVDRVLPMLPHSLSGDICSLRPDEDRLTLSVFLEMDSSGKVRSTDLAAGMIRSRYKLSYEEAQRLIDGGDQADERLVRDLRQLRELTQKLRERRLEQGGLDFDLPEARIVLNAAGEPTHVQEILRLESHQLIEELMIRVNESIARLARSKKLPFLYRIHEAPDPARTDELREFVRGLGLDLAKNAHRSSRALQKLLNSVEGRPEEGLVSMLALRSMKQARYSSETKAHFGLGIEAYSHFTSPIRRYPDLVVHRLLRKAILQGERVGEEYEDRLGEVAELASSRERRAMDAERESVELKKIEYMERHLGDVFEGTVSGVTSFGLFVLLEDVLVEGLIHVSSLEDDYYHFKEEQHALVGESHGRRFRLGDQLRARVLSVDRTARKLDLELIE